MVCNSIGYEIFNDPFARNLLLSLSVKNLENRLAFGKVGVKIVE